MDFLNKKIIAAIDHLREVILSLRESIDSSRDQQQRQREQEHAERMVPRPLLRVEAETHERPDAEIEQRSYRDSSLRAQWITAFATTAAFIAAGFYAGIAARQLRTSNQQISQMIESNKINREGLESVQRAFVTFLFNINPQGVVDSKTNKVVQWNFSIPLINDGSTPTRNMVMHLEAYASRDELPDNFTFPDTSTVTKQLIVLGPKHTTYTGYFGRIKAEAIDAVRRGQGHLYFYGWTTYNDVFRNTPQHVTKFCYELNQFGMNAFTGAGPGNTFYTAWKHHNCADSECEKEP